jgi:hypothetical protein
MYLSLNVQTTVQFLELAGIGLSAKLQPNVAWKFLKEDPP